MSRIALVLGAGGAVGRAFHGGVLAALQDAAGWDARQADLMVGTSAGSIVAAVLRAGVTPRDYAAWMAGEPISTEAARILQRGAGDPVRRPPERPQAPWGPAAPHLFLGALGRPWKFRLGTLAAAALPEGGVSPDTIIDSVHPLFGTSWSRRQLWICAVRLDDGRRVLFGADGSPPATVAEAVAASCAIPGWFAPVRIGGARYVDGGAHSLVNLDTVAGLELDLVVVSSPMSAVRAAVRASMDGALRAASHLQLRRECSRVRSATTRVILLEPDAHDLRVMGGIADAMDRTRRAAVVRHVRSSMAARLRETGLAEALRGLECIP
jgi:NTE family protein